MHTGKDKNPPDRRADHPPSMKGVWLFGLTALVATATIAAIRMSPEADPVPATQAAHAVASQAVSDQVSTEPVFGPWNEVRVKQGDTIGLILDARGLYNAEVRSTVNSSRDARALIDLKPGQILRYRLDDQNQLHDLVYNQSNTETVHLHRKKDGGYTIDEQTRDIQTRYAYVTGTIDSSLFLSGQEAGLSDALIMRLTEIFGWDIDFAINLRKGDSFSVIHEEKYWLGQKIADGPILAAEFVNQGKVYRAIGLRNELGRLEYFTPERRSIRRPFLRTPVQFSRISSRYGKRKHPILGRWRAHTGVDYAAPRGTPIRATSSGRVSFKGSKGGYGRTIIVKHGFELSTLYGHMQKFDPRVRLGSYVEQGQIIGYVGSSGLATGPHLHYELRLNGVHHNPLTYPLPKASQIAEQQLPEFEQLLARWSPRLDLMNTNRIQLAKNQ